MKNKTQSYQNIINFIKQLQQRPLGIYRITDQAKRTIATVEPSRALVWLDQDSKDILDFDLQWQLQPYNELAPDNKKAIDLLQWLWQCKVGESLLPLINDKTSYHLSYWIKPVMTLVDTGIVNAVSFVQLLDEERRELLQVMTALEHAPCTAEQLANVAGVATIRIKQILAHLLFSGCLKSANYQNLEVATLDNQRAVATQQTINDDSAISISKPPLAILEDDFEQSEKKSLNSSSSSGASKPNKLSAFEALLERRSRGEVAAPTTSSAEISFSKKAISSLSKLDNTHSISSDKSSFLSRLRQKLGL